MKKNLTTILLTAILLLCLIPSTSAKKTDTTLKTSGTFTEYLYEESAEILEGSWKAHVTLSESGPADAKFTAYYTELNIDEEVEGSPAGTIDKFWWTLDEPTEVYIDTDDYTLYIRGDIHVRKASWRLDSGKFEVYGYTWPDSVISIEKDSDAILVDLIEYGGYNFDVAGTVDKIK